MASIFRERTIRVAVGVLYLLTVRHFWFLVDDAFISFRYARNLVEGHGLRYNLGAHTPVEGYSNFLWTIACVPFEALHLEITRWPLLLSSACGLALILLLARRLRSLGVGALPTWSAVGAMAVYPPFAAWSTSGLETMPFALLLFWTFDVLILDRDGPHPVRGGIAALLLALVRFEGVAWSFALLALAFLVRRSEPAPRARRLRIAALVLVLGYGAYTAWRLVHFHEVLPNTVYAKAALDRETLLRGANYVATHVLVFLTPLLIVPASIVALGSRWRNLAWPTIVVALAVPALAIAATGDWMPFGRLLVPGAPFHAVLAAFALDRWARRRPVAAVAAGVAAAGIAALPAFGIGLVPASLVHRVAFTGSPYTQWEHLAHMHDTLARGILRGKLLRHYADDLRERFGTAPGEEASTVEAAIGAVGYYSRLHIYDRVGIVSPEVAREPVSADYAWGPGHDKWRPPTFFLDRRPTILSSTIVPRSHERACRAVQEMQRSYRDPDVLRAYAPDVARVADPDVGERVVAAWVRVPDDETPVQINRQFRARLAELGLDPAPPSTRESLRKLRKDGDDSD